MQAERSDAAIAVEEQPVRDSTASGFGEPLCRREDARMLAGAGRFIADLHVAGCLSLVFVRSPLARAAIEGLQVDAARETPGVVRIYTGIDVGGLRRPRVSPVLGDVESPDMPILADGEIRAVGQPVVAVVAESEAAASEAADRVEMDLEPREPICDPEAALAAPALFPELAGNVVAHKHWRSGDPERAFAGASVIAEAAVRHPRVAPSPLECRATLAQWDPQTERLTVWTGTQTPHRSSSSMAAFPSREGRTGPLPGIGSLRAPNRRFGRARPTLRTAKHGVAAAVSRRCRSTGRRAW